MENSTKLLIFFLLGIFVFSISYAEHTTIISPITPEEPDGYYHLAIVLCYDGDSTHFGGVDFCEHVRTWTRRGEIFCRDKCDNDKCGLKDIRFRGPCGEEFGYEVSIYTDKSSYIPGETAEIYVRVEVPIEIEKEEISVRTSVGNPEGDVTQVPMEYVTSIKQECITRGGEIYCPDVGTITYIYKGEFRTRIEGSHRIGSSGTIGQQTKTAADRFMVSREPIVSEDVEVHIIPREQRVSAGELVEYSVRIRDNHELPHPGMEDYRYQIEVIGIPYNAEYPSRVSISPGGFAAFTLKIYTSDARTTTSIEEFRVGVSATQVDNPENRDLTSAMLYVEKKSDIPTPPEFPEEKGDLVTIPLERGWNLINTPGLFYSMESTCSEGIFGFVYLERENRYITLQQAREQMSPGDFMRHISTRSFWIYSNERCSLILDVARYSTYSGLNLYEGWNLIGTTRDMVGETLNSVNHNCEFIGLYTWDTRNQEWKTTTGDRLITETYRGILVRTNNNCRFDFIDIEPPITSPEIIVRETRN